ncbi:hypothetical protein (DUF2920 domain) [Campylobacter subantarcticus LMG 24377]|uniref:DUF2920 family protein n=1 Tax=Campylobacter subantarcticus TaxID=497724 RepID=UPI000581D275|nr:DUF2920 family protein [Campylobacter subantarcticus]AJC93086.1 hypothetical protein (DUF2920 domain) [Campylobacter subantarcticus LMG 24377]EAL3938983.1 DUF2920 family protein [Campylobacter lari]
MLKNETYFIDSCDDVELNIKRESKLEYRITYDDSKEIEAIVCVINGIGGDIKDDLYISDYCARNYNVAVLNVNYHCIGNRPQIGAKFYLDNIDKFIFETSLKALGITIPYDIQKLNTFEDFHPAMKCLNKKIQDMKNNWELDRNYYLDLSVSLQPTKNEYQNFGIMQATDILNALLYIRKSPPFKVTGGGIKHILIGSSHGGYLANLCAKLAPWFVDVVIDNSSHVSLANLWRVIGFGKEIDYTQYFCFGTFHFFNNIRLCASDKTLWTTNKQSPYYFSLARKLIRETLNKDHLNIQAKYPNPKYIVYHSKFDEWVSLEEKEEYVDTLKKYGFDVEFVKITDSQQVDGKFIKNLNHGMGIPMKLLIKKHLSQILKEPLKDKICKKEISYKCDDLVYIFKEENNQIKLEIK